MVAIFSHAEWAQLMFFFGGDIFDEHALDTEKPNILQNDALMSPSRKIKRKNQKDRRSTLHPVLRLRKERVSMKRVGAIFVVLRKAVRQRQTPNGYQMFPLI